MAGRGGGSGAISCTRGRIRRRPIALFGSAACAAGERISLSRFELLPFLAGHGFGHPEGATEVDDAAGDGHAAPRTGIPLGFLRPEEWNRPARERAKYHQLRR